MLELDQEFGQTVDKVEKHLLGAKSRHIVVRVRQWVEKMSQPMPNIPWKRNRNQYALILEDMLSHGCGLDDPFDKLPPNVRLTCQ